MACNNSTQIFWSGINFSTAPQFYTDSSLTNVADNGWYSFGGVYRQMYNGLLGAPTSCPSCLFDCTSFPNKYVTGGTSPGRYSMDIDLGSTTGAVIIHFEPSVNPSQVTWSHDGISASEYSNPAWGYTEGLIGRQDSSVDGGTFTCGENYSVSNNSGSSNQVVSGGILQYDFQGGTFVQSGQNISLGPYNASSSLSAPNVNLINGSPGFFTMVVPKPNAAATSVNILIDVVCPNTEFNIKVNCPQNLNTFEAGPRSGACGTVGSFLYTASVLVPSGVSSSISVYDWAFEDINGSSPMPAGVYPVVIGGVNNFVTVDVNGVVTSVAPC